MDDTSGVRSISFAGKHNKYEMKKVIGDVERTDRVRKFEVDAEFYTHRIQVDLVKNLTSSMCDMPLQYVDTIPVFVRHIKEKLSGYLSQDRIQDRVSVGEHISYTDTVQKMIECGHRCYYCNEDIFLLCNKVRDSMQWTLDRVDNDIRHSVNNVVVACLGCNLSKRRRDVEAYRATKQMMISKCDDSEDEVDMMGVFEPIFSVNDPLFDVFSSIEYSPHTWIPLYHCVYGFRWSIRYL